MGSKSYRISMLLAAATMLGSGLAFGAENGTGFYLLGGKGPSAAITPPPGVYFQNDLYMYSGNLGGGRSLPRGGQVAVGVDGDAVLAAPTLLWVLPEEFMDARVGLSATIPFGWMKTSADLTLTGPGGGVLGGNVQDTVFTIGDPLVGGLLGWEAGNFHWQLGTLINIPVGDYQEGELSNIAFHHWGADVYAGATWLDPAIGFDLSAVIGMTFNAENPATDYRSGNELHFEWAAVQHFNEQFDAGLVGYAYQQVSGDSGDGATLGDFKGRAFAIGATVGWNFKAGDLPVAARLKYFHEFGTKNRAEGDSVFLTISIPLSITKPENVALK